MRRPPPSDLLFKPKATKPIPHAFVLDALASLHPQTNPMFGCLAVYAQEKIVLVLRDSAKSPDDNGVWLATTPEHHASLRAELPSLRSIPVLGDGVTGWQCLPADGEDFEDEALHACALIRAADPRIGKVPKARKASGAKTTRRKRT